MLFVLAFRTEHSTYFILSKVCHFVGRLKHKYGNCQENLQFKMTLTQVSERRGQTTVIKRKTVCVRLELIVRTVFESYNDCNGF